MTHATHVEIIDLIKKRNYTAIRQSKISPHFTWGEVFTNRTDKQIEACPIAYLRNAEALAKKLEVLRSKLGGRPFTITSWYRDVASNTAVGGAKRSQHLLAKAVDVTVKGLTPLEVQRLIIKNDWWLGGLGCNNVFTHLDNRITNSLIQFRY